MWLRVVFIIACIPVALAADCSAPKDAGQSCTTAAPTRMFYFNARMRVCQPMQFLGCGGNENRFANSAACREACSAPSPTPSQKSTTSTTPSVGQNSTTMVPDQSFVPQGTSHGQWRKAELCGGDFLVPDGKYLLCSAGCPKNHSCVSGVCCPSKDYVCSLRDDNGHFQNGIEDRPRFAYNHMVKSCERYSYYGSAGNYNNFPNFASCRRFCDGAVKIDVSV